MFFKKYTITLYQSQMYNLHVPGSVERDALKWSLVLMCLHFLSIKWDDRTVDKIGYLW